MIKLRLNLIRIFSDGFLVFGELLFVSSNFSTIGMPVESEEDMMSIAQQASENAIEIKCKRGKYLHWSSESGAELWLQIDKSNNLVGLTPYYRGFSSMNVAITNEVVRKVDTVFEKQIHGWADPQGEEPDSGMYPFLFELPDSAVYGEFDYPFISKVSLSAFTQEITIYQSEEEYDSQQEGEPKFAVESFIPSGLFTDDNRKEPEPYAIFTGKVIKTEEKENPLTGGKYNWALVKTLGGTIDVVTDLEHLTKPIVIGGVISGSFWLCGRVLEPQIRERRSFFQKIFNR